MAFNPGGITYADPFGAFLTGNVIGREQNRADSALKLQQQQEARAQDQFDWSKVLRPGQQRIQDLSIEQMAGVNARTALENAEFADFAQYRRNAAQRADRAGELTLGAAEITTMPQARAAATQAEVAQRFALPMAQAGLDGQQADAAYRGVAVQKLQDDLIASQASRAWTPVAISQDGSMVTISDFRGGYQTVPTTEWQMQVDEITRGIMGQRGAQPAAQTPAADPFGMPAYGAPAAATPASPASPAQPQPQPPQYRPPQTIRDTVRNYGLGE